VFPIEVSILPVSRDVDFTIDMILGPSPVFVAPYRMTLVELVELKK